MSDVKKEYVAPIIAASAFLGAGFAPEPDPVVEVVTEVVKEEVVRDKVVHKMPPVIIEAWNNSYSTGSQETRRAMGGRIGPNTLHKSIATAVQGLTASHNALSARQKSALERYREATQ